MGRAQPTLGVPTTDYPDARILVVDDDPSLVRLLEIILSDAGYTAVSTTTDSADFSSLCTTLHPDVVLIDLHMPDPDGFALLEHLASDREAGEPSALMPVIVLSGDDRPHTRERVLALGAADLIRKPIELNEVLLRVRNVLGMRHRQVELEHRVRLRTAELEQARYELLERLALTAEYRDDDTHEHTRRVGTLAQQIAEHMCPAQADVIGLAAPLHDIGKVGIPDAILLKREELTPQEAALIRQHVEIGRRILADSTSPVLRRAEEIAYTHHERWDGNGYPSGLAGADIPLSGRITAVADVFDALTHSRPYKEAWPIRLARFEIAQAAGRQFDPDVVEVFLGLNVAV